MKFTRVFSLLLCLMLTAALLPAPVFAAGAITIQSVTFDPYEDAYGARDDALITVRVAFTAPEGMSQISVLLAGADLASVTTSNKHQVIYQNQVETPETGLLVFPVEKARIASATGLPDANGATLYLRLGGTGASTAKQTVSYSEPAPVYGDLNGDGEIDISDAILLLRYYAGLTSLTLRQLDASDVTQDGNVDNGDALRILLYEAGIVDTILKQ